jgi:hypothetical protein
VGSAIVAHFTVIEHRIQVYLMPHHHIIIRRMQWYRNHSFMSSVEPDVLYDFIFCPHPYYQPTSHFVHEARFCTEVTRRIVT